jgi:hypothetical protein
MFEQEAATEIAPGHELHGLALEAVAKCEACDSVTESADPADSPRRGPVWASRTRHPHVDIVAVGLGIDDGRPGRWARPFGCSAGMHDHLRIRYGSL